MDIDKSYLKMRTQTDQVRYEFTNQDTIVLRKSGAYHKAVGNSAIMLKILGAKTKIKSVYNKVYEQEVYELNLHSTKIKETKEYLVSISSGLLRNDEEFYVVRLKAPISIKRIKKARSSLELKTEATEDILLKHRKFTPLGKEVRDIFTEIGLLVRAMKNQDAMVLGRVLIEKTLQLQAIIRSIMRTEVPSEEQLVFLEDTADDLQGLLLLVPNFVEQSGRLSRIGRSLNEVRSFSHKQENHVKTRA